MASKSTITPYYQDELVTLYHGDAVDFVADIPSDLVVTDPPYGVNYDLGNDTDAPDNRGHVDEILAACNGSSLLAFGTFDRYSPPSWAWRWSLVWHKPMARANPAWGVARHYELIHWYTRGTEYIHPENTISDVISANPPLFRTNPENVAHPAQKPLATIGYLLTAWQGELVLDPFVGSGTLLVAAREHGRHAVGIEIDERYCEIAATRLAQGSLFGDVA